MWNWGTRVLRTRKHEIYCEIVSPRNDKNYSHKISQHDCQNVRRTKATTEDMLAWTESLESLAPTHTKKNSFSERMVGGGEIIFSREEHTHCLAFL